MESTTAERTGGVPADQERALPKEIVIRCSRWTPSVGGKAQVKQYTVPYVKGMTVLDALLYVKENIDPSLSFRYSCRMGICGSCGMLVNGRPMLACETQITELPPKPVETEPLSNYDPIRDLATDFSDFFAHYRFVKPYLIREDTAEQDSTTIQYPQTERDRLQYLQFSYCIMCGLCDAACPPYAMDTEYLGPQALAAAYRWMADTRDEGRAERASAVDQPHGCWQCHVAQTCSVVCPKGIDPALGIQLLKRLLLFRSIAKQ